MLVLLRCICARVLVGHALRRGRGSRSLSSLTSRSLFLSNPSIHRDSPLCRTYGGHRTESDRARPGTTQDGCVSLTRGRQTRRGKDNPGINGTCCYVIVGPVPEQRDTGQEARGTFPFSTALTLLPILRTSFSFLPSFPLSFFPSLRHTPISAFPSLSRASAKSRFSKIFPMILRLTGCRRHSDTRHLRFPLSFGPFA